MEPVEIGQLLIKGGHGATTESDASARATPCSASGSRPGTCSRDADGIYVAGRADDMLKVGGQWVSPGEIEARLVEHPAVLEAGVVGRQDADGLTKLCAYVALKPGQTATGEDLRGWVRGRLAG